MICCSAIAIQFFLGVCVRRKRLCKCLFFPLFVGASEIDWQSFLLVFHHSLPMERVTKIGLINLKCRLLSSHVSHWQNHVTIWCRGRFRSPGKLKLLYLHYRNTYDNLTWQNGDLPWGAPTYKVAWPFDHMFLQDDETNWNHCISNVTVPIDTRLGRMVIYLEGLIPIELPHTFVTWPSKITGQTKTVISPLPQSLWPLNLAGWWLTMKGSHSFTHGVTWAFYLLVLLDHVTN